MEIFKKNFLRNSLLLSVFLLSIFCADAVSQDFNPARQLVKRRVPFLYGKVEFKQLSADEAEGDVFRLHTADNKLIVEANTLSAATTAVNHYLNHYCHMSISRNGDNLSYMDVLPAIAEPVTKKSPFRYRYALNYCTYNYTYSFYNWADFEWELDWMALNGVNLMLAPVGTKFIWQKTLSAIGFSDKEIKDFMPGQAFTAWWLMGNLEGWGGPLNDAVIQRQAALQKKILNRMQELGIEPVLQGFWGMVPSLLQKKYPKAKIVEQGLWCNFQRPAVLLPEDALFGKLADIYYRIMQQTYGKDIKFLGGDLFHEGGSSENINVKETARLVQAGMQKHFPGSKWVLQGWGGNPKKELMEGLDPAHTLVIDLFGESGQKWKSTDEFYGTPWIWATVNHFGGKTDLGGQLPVIIKGPHEAMKESKGGLMQGIGILPEGIMANPVVYDWALKTAWDDNGAISTDKYIRDYIMYRYGTWNDDAYKAWQLLLQSVYGEFAIKGEGTFESIFCARPGMDVTSVSTWGPKRFQYDPLKLVVALGTFRKAAAQYSGSPAYKYDLVDLARQVLANHVRTVYNNSIKAFREKRTEDFEAARREFLSLLSLQDRLLGTEETFLLGRWLEKARQNGGVTPEEKNLAEKNARIQISYWGPADPATPLHDYANKEWNGFISDYYLPRWEAFYADLRNQLSGAAPAKVDYFAMEKAWSESRGSYPVTPSGDYLEMVDSVLMAVSPLYKNPAASPEDRVADLMNRMTLPEKIAQMKHIHFKHYDSDGTVDLNKLAASTNGLSYGCIEAFPYSSEKYLKAIYKIQKYMKEKTRLGIPVIPVMEGLHGMVQDGSTIYPQSIALGSTFNPSLVEQMTGNIALEMKAIGAKQVLAPVLDLSRELRWGRVEEAFGEDPYLVARMGIAYTKGIHRHSLITTPKHFVAHGTPTAGLNLASVKGGKRDLLDLYIKPFEELIEETKPLSIMNCYSVYDSEAVTASPYMMTTLLRDSLKFRGYVYSDWGSVSMLSYFHRSAANGEEAARQAIEAGIDLEAGSDEYRHIEKLMADNRLDMKYIDRAVYNILYAKFASGLFDDPLPDTLNWKNSIHTPASVEVVRKLANESIVLLENKNNMLPLSPGKFSSIAVIGPNADQVQFGDYSWSSNNADGVTPLQGMKDYLGEKVKLNYAKGCDLYSQDKLGFKEALKIAKKSDITVIFVGSQSALLARPSEPATSGEGFDLSDLKLPGVQQELIEEVSKAGKPFIVVLVTGKPFAIPWIKDNANALLVQWYGGEQAGNAIAAVLFGDVNPSGRLPVSFPQSVGHLPAYYNYLPTDKGYYNRKGTPNSPGRDYVFSNPASLYPFGYGLGYTDFGYSNLRVSDKEVSAGDTLFITADVSNTGNREGKEVAQLYIRDMVSSVAVPVKQLQAFEKVSLEKGETKTIKFAVPVNKLSLHNQNYERVVEPGDFEIQVGTSSGDILLRDTVNVISENERNMTNTATEEKSTDARKNMGEEITVTGTVRNVQAAVMSGVSVATSLNPDKVSVSGKDGKYAVRARINDRLTFSLSGYKTVTVIVSPSGILNIDMIAEIE